MTRALTYINILALLILCSCSTLKNTVSVGKGERNSILSVPHVLDHNKEVQIFDLKMNYKEEEFSGLLIMKKYGLEHYRIVLTSYFGMTVFDMELNKQDFLVHYCIQPLNKKRALYLLRNDFAMLIKPNFFKNIKYKLDEHSRLSAFERKGSITKTVMFFCDYSEQWPQKVKIEHPYLNLYITLTSLSDVTTLPI